ncbi:MAG: PhoU family transcriptional regulator [Candidatus Bathyarchaeota archaeon]|nr:PhoU family transcriptional regulator [Candidatus Bathyarchaeota archaeon]
MNENNDLSELANKLAILKNTSELMIDLAYSSLLFNSRELAEEVQMLEERVDNMHTEFEHSVLTSLVNTEDSKNYLGLIRIGVSTERIADAAARIADVVLRGLETHPVMKLVIEEAEETVTRVQIDPNSSITGKTLREARIPLETGMWVIVIRRGNDWFRPQSETQIRAGDVLIASGYADGEEDLLRLASGVSPTEL